jgi:hypothetical protein
MRDFGFWILRMRVTPSEWLRQRRVPQQWSTPSRILDWGTRDGEKLLPSYPPTLLPSYPTTLPHLTPDPS